MKSSSMLYCGPEVVQLCRIGESLTTVEREMVSTIVETEKKSHQYVDLDVVMLAQGEPDRVISRVMYRAIYKMSCKTRLGQAFNKCLSCFPGMFCDCPRITSQNNPSQNNCPEQLPRTTLREGR